MNFASQISEIAYCTLHNCYGDCLTTHVVQPNHHCLKIVSEHCYVSYMPIIACINNQLSLLKASCALKDMEVSCCKCCQAFLSRNFGNFSNQQHVLTALARHVQLPISYHYDRLQSNSQMHKSNMG